MSDAPVKKTKGNRVGDGTPGPGRPKGVANKTTRVMREAITAFAEGRWEKVKEKFDAMLNDDPKAALAWYKDLMEYVTPKLGRTEVAGDKSEPLSVNLVHYARSTEEIDKRIKEMLGDDAPAE